MSKQKFLLVTVLLLGLGACGTEPKKETPPPTPPKPEAPKPPPQPAEWTYIEEVCKEDDFFGCYEQLKVNGSVDGSIVVDVAKDGTITNVSYTGSAPKPVQECMIAKVKEKKQVKGFTGDPLQMNCGYSGTLNNGIRMTMWSPNFKRMPADAPAASSSAPASAPAK